MDILVYGAGSLGSVIGGLLAREHDVTLLGRDPHVQAITDHGLEIVGERRASVTPSATTTLDSQCTPDLVIVTVKAYDTAEAARDLARSSPGSILSLQNGMGNEETLTTHLDAPVLAGTTSYGARLQEPGVVACTGVGSVTLGPHGDTEMETAIAVGEALRHAGLDTTVVENMQPHLWEKLAINAGINPVTALAGVENGALLEGPAANVAARAARETAAVANEHGVDIPEDRATQVLRSVAKTTARNRSSMCLDVDAGRRTEIDAINGYVLDNARRDVPVNTTLASLLRAWEAGEGLR